ncbi:MAG: prepilin peptidase [Desulfitobacteriaceae bacterium]|nr:prepilin peptidase [Desulfitobacteriaceae bacterium]MDD4346835.1 prepilin peptidase [Desulfitobacteriaceae bacterium]MDD4401054.1 prepilin peptidase [Desulfitobacteriaceae bacterium]
MTIISLFYGILGLIIGSFLNVVIYRVPRGESIVSPGSHCLVCGHALSFWELIPVLSFIIQKGSCRKCGTSISCRYPAVEILTGGLFFYTVWLNQGVQDARVFWYLVFVAILIALAFIDLDTMTLPDGLVYPLLIIGLLGSFVLPGTPGWLESVLAAAAAGGAFWLITLVYPQGMGFGDVKFVAALGAFLGFPHIILAVFSASLAGSIIGLSMLLLHRRKIKQPIPFGPFLSFGALAVLFWGDQIIQFYCSRVFC